MNYFINPSWFYWLNVINEVKGSLIALLVISAILGAIGWIAYGMCRYSIKEWPSISEKEERAMPVWLRVAIISSIAFGILLLVNIFVPTKDTLVEMMIAKFATYENVDLTVDAIKGIADYIIEAIQTVA